MGQFALVLIPVAAVGLVVTLVLRSPLRPGRYVVRRVPQSDAPMLTARLIPSPRAIAGRPSAAGTARPVYRITDLPGPQEARANRKAQLCQRHPRRRRSARPARPGWSGSQRAARPSTGSADKQARYAPVRVKLIQPHGDGWIVDGIDDDDDIVVHGAGVLWALQGIIGRAAGDNDDD